MSCSKQFSITVDDEDNCILTSGQLPQGSIAVPGNSQFYSVTLLPAFAPDPGMKFQFEIISGSFPDGFYWATDADPGDTPGKIVGYPRGAFGEFCVRMTQVPI